MIGFQILLGVGLGAAVDNTITGIQTEYAREEEFLAQATALVNVGELFGDVIGVAIGGGTPSLSRYQICIDPFSHLLAIFQNQLVVGLAKFAPNLDPDQKAAVRSRFVP